MAATIPVFAALHRYRKQTASGHAPSAGPHPHQQPDRSCCCMDNWNSNALFRDRDEQRQMGIQSAKDRTRYSMGNHRRRRSTVECSREVSGRALRRNSNREDGCNSACASIPEPGLSVSPSPPVRGQGEGHKIRIDLFLGFALSGSRSARPSARRASPRAVAPASPRGRGLQILNLNRLDLV